ncbi:MAG: transposase [Thermodesulfobacteriota bacterium]|nr:transposase [Thermodesulfobacteriota bacterium]MDY6905837.1 transposase [Thermodesulfobacteriota bacterium]
MRKKRKGAFWEDRYHATAVQNGDHFIRCLVYIDLNMVRAGVVSHPAEWPFGGYYEIMNPKERYSVVDREKLMDLLAIASDDVLKEHRRDLVDYVLETRVDKRVPMWTEMVAVGTEEYITDIYDRLGIRIKGREIMQDGDSFSIKEEQVPYGADFGPKKGILSPQNSYFWDV